MTRTRWTFTDEFKREAVALLESSGRPLMQVVAELRRRPREATLLRDYSESGEIVEIFLQHSLACLINNCALCHPIEGRCTS